MKKLLICLPVILLFSFMGVGGLFAQGTGVEVKSLHVNADNSCTFRLEWSNQGRHSLWSDNVWVFIEYYDPNDANNMKRLRVQQPTVTNKSWEGVTVRMPYGNDGFYVDGNAQDAGTFWVELKVDPLGSTQLPGASLRYCVYATDYQPVARYGADAQGKVTVDFTGTSPFSGTYNDGTAWTVPAGSSSLVLPAGKTIPNGFIDKTGNKNGIVLCGTQSGININPAYNNGSLNPTVCNGDAFHMEFTIAGSANSASITGLPAGLSATFSGRTLTISGTPTVTNTSGTSYTVTTSGEVTPCTPVSIGGKITVIDGTAPGTLAGNQTINYSASGMTLTPLTVTGHKGNVIRWEESTDGGTNFTTIPGTESVGATYTPSTAAYVVSTETKYYWYRAVVKSSTVDCECGELATTPVVVTVYPESFGGDVTLATQTICSGTAPATLTLSNNVGTIQRWEESKDNGSTWNPITNTAGAASYTPGTLTITGGTTTNFQYRAIVQSNNGSAATSTVATVKVVPSSNGGVLAPPTQALYYGSTAGALTLSGQVGAILGWEDSTRTSGWQAVNPANTGTSLNPGQLESSRSFRVKVQHADAGVTCPVAYSNIVKVQVTDMISACPGLAPGRIGATAVGGGNTDVCDELRAGRIGESGAGNTCKTLYPGGIGQ